MDNSCSPKQNSRVIDSFLFEPIPFDSVEVCAIVSAEAKPVPCGRLIREECRYEDYSEGLLDAFSAFGISLDQENWDDEYKFRDFLTSTLNRYNLRL